MRSSLLKSALKVLAAKIFPLVPIAAKRQAMYYWKHHRLIPEEPTGFFDKIQWRILHDRRPLIAVGGDKLAMKEYAAKMSAEVLVPETLWAGSDLEAIYDIDWGCDWVLKPREGAGAAVFGSGSFRESRLSLEEIKRWKHRQAFKVWGEWAYGQSGPGYLLEKRIPTKDGGLPLDTKVFVFGGKAGLILVSGSKYSDVHACRYYSPDWTPLDFSDGGRDLAAVVQAPERLSVIVDIAESIGKDFDFIRVDLYDVPEGVFFGELSPYPTGGTSSFGSSELDCMVGSWWSLPNKSEVRR